MAMVVVGDVVNVNVGVGVDVNVVPVASRRSRLPYPTTVSPPRFEILFLNDTWPFLSLCLFF